MKLLRTFLRAASATALLGALAACGGGNSGAAQDPTSTSASSGKGKATDFSARDTEGKTVHLSDHLGKSVILIDFWATTCQPCLAAFPHIRRIYEQNKPNGFVVLAVSMDGPETVANVPAFAKRNNLTFPVLVDDDSAIAGIYNPKKSEPFVVLIDKSGKIVRVREGYNPGDEKLIEDDVVKLMAGQSL